jgi:hypothetical protein
VEADQEVKRQEAAEGYGCGGIERKLPFKID